VSYRIRFHPAVAADLEALTRWLLTQGGPKAAERRLDEIEAVIASLGATPHKGSLRNEIAHGLRAIPAGRKTVVAFVVDDAAHEVLIYAVSYAGSDWALLHNSGRRGFTL